MATETIPQPNTEQQSPAGAAAGAGKRRRILLVLALIAAVLVTTMWLLTRGKESTDDAEIEGHVEAISPRVAGTVTEVDVLEGQNVQAGQVLFKLDDSEYKVAVQRAQADLDAARAQAAGAQSGVPVTSAATGGQLSAAQAGLQEARAGRQLAQRQVDVAEARQAAAQAELSQAQANADKARSDLARYTQLVQKDEVSQQQYQSVQTASKAADAAVAAAGAQLNAARQGVAAAAAQADVAGGKIAEAAANVRAAASAPEQVTISRSRAATAQAQVALAEAALAQAQLNLSYTVVTAPTGGLIGNKHVEVGQTFAPGQPALAIVPASDPSKDFWVIADFKETQLEHMRPGQRVHVSVDAYGDDLKGHIEAIGAATGARFSLLPPENATGNFVKVVQRVPVKIVFEPGQDLARLRPGMSVEATVYVQ